MENEACYKILLEALHWYGGPTQMAKAEEECAELIVALKHFKLGKATAQDVISEIADVEIMSKQMQILFDTDAVRKEIYRKLERLQERIKAEKNLNNDGEDD